MHNLLKIGEKTYALTTEQLEVLTDVLFGTPYVHNEYAGGTKGDDGTAYIKLLKQPDVGDGLTVSTVPSSYIGALELKTKLYFEAKGK